MTAASQTSTRRSTAGRRLAHGCAVAMAGTRTALGLAAISRPGWLAQGWLGPEHGAGSRPAVRILGRASGGRDLVLGLGALAALAGRGGGAGRWVAAGGVVDAVDGAATVAAWSSLPRGTRAGFLAAAGGTALASFAICAGLGEEP